MRNYLTFDNKDSRDFGVYINGQGTFRAPARSYNVLNIPGRNGDLLGFGSKLENVEITYRAFIYTNFDANIAALRSFLLSHVGYFKMTDSYHPDEYRLAYYKGPFVPDVVANNGAGSFDLTFVCKPQRFLNSGEEVTTLTPAGAEQHTYQGEIVNFSTLAGDKITSARADFHPIQDLHGYSSPWPAGGGVNLLPADYTESVTLSKAFLFDTPLPAGQYTFSFISTDTSQQVASYQLGRYRDETGSYVFTAVNPTRGFATFTNTEPCSKIVLYSNKAYNESTGFTTVFTGLMFKAGGTGPYSPYSNICPISGRTGLSVYVSPTTAQADATTYAVDWTDEAGTVYGGTLDVVTGVLTVDRVCETITKDSAWLSFYTGTGNSSAGVYLEYYNNCKYVDGIHSRNGAISSTGEEAPNYWAGPRQNEVPAGDMCFAYSSTGLLRFHRTDVANITDLNAFKAAFPDTQICYYLATPLTYLLTPQEVEALAENYMWSDVGQVTVTVTDAMTIENPTLFDAKPLLRVYGAGTLTLGGQTITISTADVYTDIDCEMMDCFKDTVSKNGNVSFSGYDFPVIPPGRNVITMDGVTQVDITPRWWAT